MLTALNLKEIPTDDTGGRVGRHMEIQIFDGEIQLVTVIYIFSNRVMAAYDSEFHEGTVEVSGY